MIYETTVTETRIVSIRVRADSPEEAEETFREFMEKENDYILEELSLNGEQWITPSEFKEVHPAYWDEKATITKNEDGTFEAEYEGGDER